MSAGIPPAIGDFVGTLWHLMQSDPTIVRHAVDAGNDMFQCFPMRKNLEQLELRVCDGKGRSLAQLDPQQADNGLMKWSAVLRFDLFKPPQETKERFEMKAIPLPSL